MKQLDWLAELDLTVADTWPRMGTRSLKGQPWLLADAHAFQQLALRAELLTTRTDEVLAEPTNATPAAMELEAMVRAAGVAISEGASPLDRLGRSVQEDFCLLERGEHEWVLKAAVLCFPSRWKLAAKIGRPLTQVHGPTPRYQELLAQRVTTAFDRLEDRTILRRNWFVHPDPALFQPNRPAGGDRVISAKHCGDELWVRSERQTLRRLPDTGWVVFTIRVQQCRFGELLERRLAEFSQWFEHATEELRSHVGIRPEQVQQIRLYLAEVERVTGIEPA